MSRQTTDQPITTRNARLALAARSEPYWRALDTGVAVGYRKGRAGGFWVGRVLLDGKYREGRLGRADDNVQADGTDLLDFRQAAAQAKKWAARQFRLANGSSAQDSRRYTVAQALEDYLTDFADRGGKGLSQTRSAITAHIRPVLGEIALERLTRDRLKAWHRGLAASPARLRSPRDGDRKNVRDDRDDPDAPRRRRATANRVLTILKAALNHALAEGKVDCSDAAWAPVKPFRETDKPKLRYLRDDEVMRLVNACPPDLRVLVSGALVTGARYGELAAMRVGDFDPQAGTVAISFSKSGRSRHVVLADEGRALFAQLSAGRSAAELMFQRELLVKQATRDRPAKTRRSGWGRAHQVRPLQEACKNAGIVPAASFHTLRHSYASRLAMACVPMPVIQVQLGHADLRMTKRYAHLAPDFVANAIRSAFLPLGLVPETNVAVFRAAG